MSHSIKNIPDDDYNTVWFFADIIREKGLDKVTVDDLVTEITPKARGKSPPLKFSFPGLFPPAKYNSPPQTNNY